MEHDGENDNLATGPDVSFSHNNFPIIIGDKRAVLDKCTMAVIEVNGWNEQPMIILLNIDSHCLSILRVMLFAKLFDKSLQITQQVDREKMACG